MLYTIVERIDESYSYGRCQDIMPGLHILYVMGEGWRGVRILKWAVSNAIQAFIYPFMQSSYS